MHLNRISCTAVRVIPVIQVVQAAVKTNLYNPTESYLKH